ncbi:MAG: precorrin-6A reductase [Eubacteriales bacterium]|nr:precorrin-6A reductase [Eubacteriales bacterium]
MKQILIFSGTTEGRKLAELLAQNDVASTVCVATEYGELVMQKEDDVHVVTGRMDADEMLAFMQAGEYAVVVDATHPFATLVSENIRQSANQAQLPYMRLKRETDCGMQQDTKQIVYYENAKSCAQALKDLDGNILLTTGSKDLAIYCEDGALKDRLYVRVLPAVPSLELCQEAGISGKQIIALQGPFTQELNEALIRQYEIKHLVTKESGLTGGFLEKINAAMAMGISVSVIGNPEEQPGLSFSEVIKQLETRLGVELKNNKTMHISLIGVGMGNADTMTGEATRALKQAHYVFGAKRVIEPYIGTKETYPYYLERDIVPMLTTWMDESMETEIRVAILFSGDSGFYSGCEKMYQALTKWGVNQDVTIRIYPGISSVVYLAAAAGVNWQDAHLMSVHGKGEPKDWAGEIVSAVSHNEKTFVLVSGVQDVHAIGDLLETMGTDAYKLCVGYQLSYPEEEVVWCQPADCRRFVQEGLYVCLVVNGQPQKRWLSPGSKDDAFLRERVPMTKEEVRQLALCKLGLYEGAVVYDVGSGTGSVTVDIAKMSDTISVFAIEKKPEAVRLTKENVKHAGLYHVFVVEGTAPEVFDGLPVPTHAFIGGSSGNLMEIVDALYQKNPRIRIVMTAVSLETVSQMNEILRTYPVTEEELIAIQVSRAKKAGGYHLMQAENPIYMASFCLRDR